MRLQMKLAPLVLATVACARATSSGGVSAAGSACRPFPAIDSAQMLSDLSRIAADSMRGRLIGSPGNLKTRDFLAARFDAIGLETLPPGRVQPFAVDSIRRRGVSRGWNVVGLITGKRYTNRYIVITAHFDHIGAAGAGSCRAIGADSICNGADDNGSGTAAVLAMARWFSRHRPEHSLLFAELDGEEAGLLGANAFVANPPVPLASMQLNVNLDMVSRNGNHQLYAAGPTRYPALEPLVQAIADCAPVTLLIGHDRPGTLRDDWTNQSDQGAFARRNIPFVYFGVEDHPDYHRPGDEVSHIMPGFYVNAVRTVTAFVERYDITQQ